MDNIFLTFVVIIIVIFFVSMFKFLGLGQNAVFNYKSDVKKIPKEFKQSSIKEDKTLLGINGSRKIYVGNNAKHIFVCGTTGSGKTVALANFINSCFEYDYPALIVDGKGDTGADSIVDIVTKLNAGRKKVYIINMNDPEKSDKYNPFKNTSPTIIKDMLINLTEWSEEQFR